MLIPDILSSFFLLLLKCFNKISTWYSFLCSRLLIFLGIDKKFGNIYEYVKINKLKKLYREHRQIDLAKTGLEKIIQTVAGAT